MKTGKQMNKNSFVSRCHSRNKMVQWFAEKEQETD